MVTSLAADLQREFPDQRGWSRSNLLYMRRAAEAWPTEEEFVHHVGGRLPWRHVTVLLDRLKTREERDWYAASAAEYGWSRAPAPSAPPGARRTQLAPAHSPTTPCPTSCRTAPTVRPAVAPAPPRTCGADSISEIATDPRRSVSPCARSLLCSHGGSTADTRRRGTARSGVALPAGDRACTDSMAGGHRGDRVGRAVAAGGPDTRAGECCPPCDACAPEEPCTDPASTSQREQTPCVRPLALGRRTRNGSP